MPFNRQAAAVRASALGTELGWIRDFRSMAGRVVLSARNRSCCINSGDLGRYQMGYARSTYGTIRKSWC
jgi:hypothetical protein